MGLFKKFCNGVNRAITVMMASFLLVAVMVIGYQVFTRYILNFTPPWSEELARYSNIWITMLGIGAVLRRREHIKLDYLETVFTEKNMNKSRLMLEMISTTVTAAFFIFLVYGGFKILKAAARQIAPGLHVSMLYVYISIPIGCLIALFLIIERIYDGIAKVRRDAS
jgi:TRAP-type C4-dicarboxylate transport system permease small subunit